MEQIKIKVIKTSKNEPWAIIALVRVNDKVGIGASGVNLKFTKSGINFGKVAEIAISRAQKILRKGEIENLCAMVDLKKSKSSFHEIYQTAQVHLMDETVDDGNTRKTLMLVV